MFYILWAQTSGHKAWSCIRPPLHEAIMVKPTSFIASRTVQSYEISQTLPPKLPVIDPCLSRTCGSGKCFHISYYRRAVTLTNACSGQWVSRGPFHAHEHDCRLLMQLIRRNLGQQCSGRRPQAATPSQRVGGSVKADALVVNQPENPNMAGIQR